MEPIGKAKQQDRRFDAYKLNMLHDLRRILVVVIALVAVFCLIFGISHVSGVSMQDSFQNGELVFYTRVTQDIKRGDVVSVRIPSGEYYIKRVIALGGDEVDLRDGVIYINGVPEKEDYIKGITLPEGSGVSYPLVVQDGDYFVVGDNRQESLDSRSFGAVSRKQIRGVIRFSLGWLWLHFH